jgi:leucyl-tRNA synthetase
MYPFKELEKFWLQNWANLNSDKFIFDKNKQNYYCLEMFMYPSGNIHMGHVRNYVLGDVCARYKKAQGFNVLHPMGWDAFGLPAENAAISKGVSPRIWTESNIKNMRAELKRFGLSYDWSREIKTCDPEYYKFEQKFFLEFLNKGIAYRKETYVNWDPVDKTVLANEQVIDGVGWRSGAKVVRKKMNGWFLSVSDYAQELLDGLETLDNWPKAVTSMQREWIGRSEGLIINFKVSGSDETLKMYTTRAETLFGATFCAISAQHPFLERFKDNKKISEFIQECNSSSLDQQTIDKLEKKGIDTGIEIEHPLLENVKLPLYIANFVLMDYGTGAVFACPAHDQRDFDFAKKYDLEIKSVIHQTQENFELPYLEDGKLCNSDFLDGFSIIQARSKIADKLISLKIGEKKINYKLRDWGVSRQRFWGCPIPIIYCKDCGAVPVPEDQLPLILPEDTEFDSDNNPLLDDSWRRCQCPKCDRDALRETDTFDTFYESSWYFLRFCFKDTNFTDFNDPQINELIPVDQYIGGIEHAVLHLLYARFFIKALRDIKYIQKNEPFKNLLTQGMVTHMSFKKKDGEYADVNNVFYDNKSKKYITDTGKEEVIPQRIEKMSKSKKNGITPTEIIDSYGVDAARLFMMSDSPPEKDLLWSDSGIEGSLRFLNKIWRFYGELSRVTKNLDYQLEAIKSHELYSKVNKILMQYEVDIENLKYNRVVSHIRTVFNEMTSVQIEKNNINILNYSFRIFLRISFYFVPYITSHIWSKFSPNDYLHDQLFPSADQGVLGVEEHKIMIQVNGKLRGDFVINKELTTEEYKQLALENQNVTKFIAGNKVKKIIVIPKRIVNVVI